MKNILQIAAVFIGTIVGAGLASGQEITQFFTTYGFQGFVGIIVCGLLYIPICSFIVSISTKYKLKSYTQLIQLVSPGYLGKITDLLTSFFLISGAAIILAGSGALLHQYFNVSKWVGIILMVCMALFVLLQDTKGLITINSFIVPTLITIITSIFVLYLISFKDNITLNNILSIRSYKVQILPNQWILSTLLYAGFNILCCSGVLVPLCKDTEHKKALVPGIILGALGLTVLSLFINLMLALNMPNIFKFDIPLLYIANNLGPIIQIILLIIIWCEMFSTEVSDIYSVAKTVEEKFNISYKGSVLLIIIAAIPISQIGFKNLIGILYPGFGAVSLIFIIQLIIFYKQKCKN